MSVTNTVEFDHVAEGGAGRGERRSDVLEHLLGLRRGVAVPDEVALRVHRDLARHRHDPARRGHHLAVAVPGRHPGRGEVMLHGLRHVGSFRASGGWRPRQDSNLRFRLRRPTLYPLSYGGVAAPSLTTAPSPPRADALVRVPGAGGGPGILDSMSEEIRVLLVDDDPAMLRLLQVNFRLEGFAVETASRGDEAVEHALASPPDALVLDVMMPGLDGYQVAARLREEPTLAGVPIVFLTARVMEEDRAQGEAIGNADYLTKPFDPAELIATVRRRVAAGSDPA